MQRKYHNFRRQLISQERQKHKRAMIEVLIKRHNMFLRYFELDQEIKASRRPDPRTIKEMEQLTLEIKEEMGG